MSMLSLWYCKCWRTVSRSASMTVLLIVESERVVANNRLSVIAHKQYLTYMYMWNLLCQRIKLRIPMRVICQKDVLPSDQISIQVCFTSDVLPYLKKNFTQTQFQCICSKKHTRFYFLHHLLPLCYNIPLLTLLRDTDQFVPRTLLWASF